jgi:hypothetical protein
MSQSLDGAGERIGLHLLADQSGQAFGTRAEVDRPSRPP